MCSLDHHLTQGACLQLPATAGKTLHSLEDVDALARQETNFSIRMETEELWHFDRESLLNEPRLAMATIQHPPVTESPHEANDIEYLGYIYLQWKQ